MVSSVKSSQSMRPVEFSAISLPHKLGLTTSFRWLRAADVVFKGSEVSGSFFCRDAGDSRDGRRKTFSSVSTRVDCTGRCSFVVAVATAHTALVDRINNVDGNRPYVIET
nr:hypothetical protein CFP56_69512 [Quercus suber]